MSGPRSGPRITAVDVHDVRFLTSRTLDGSDAMHPDPDCSAAYAVVRTDAPDGHEGHGFAFTIGRGNEVQAAAITALAPLVVGRPLDATLADLGGVWTDLVHDPQLAMFDYVAVSGSMDRRIIEYVDHLHEHFVDPVVLRRGRYQAPSAAGFSAAMRPESLVRYAYPHGAAGAGGA